MLERRIRHLARCFHLVALAASAPAVWLACSSNDDAASHDAGAKGPDATADVTNSGDDDEDPVADAAKDTATRDAQNDAIDAGDADGGSCWGSQTAIDGGGPDGEELCLYYFP